MAVRAEAAVAVPRQVPAHLRLVLLAVGTRRGRGDADVVARSGAARRRIGPRAIERPGGDGRGGSGAAAAAARGGLLPTAAVPRRGQEAAGPTDRGSMACEGRRRLFARGEGAKQAATV